MSSLSVNDFRKLLRDEVPRAAKDAGFDPSQEGWGFQAWVRELLMKGDMGLEELDDCPYTSDGGVDLFLADQTRKFSVVVSCKYQGDGKDIKREQLEELLSAHRRLGDKKWIGSLKPIAQAYLSSYREMVRSGYDFKFIFVSSGKASNELHELVQAANRDFRNRELPIEAELWDFTRLKDEWDRAEKLVRDLPDSLTLKLQEGKWVELNFDRPTILGAIKGNELRNHFLSKKDSLFAYNIRTFMGLRGLNSSIRASADDRPSDFFFFNNGVTAICTDYTITGNEISVDGFQIINGAQTVGALSKADPNDDLYVQFRLIKSDNTKSDTGINREIIQFNNTQNPVRLSDFKSNDPIQTWLESQFKGYGWKSKSRVYSAKRGGVARGAIGLEELSKLICAYTHNPTEILSSPKALWTSAEDESYGIYEKLFGSDGALVNAWTDERFRELTFIVESMDCLLELIQIEADSNKRFFKRLRYHALGLLGVLIRGKPQDRVLSDKISSNLVSEHWPKIKQVLGDQYYTHVEEGGSTFFAFVRNPAIWEGMVKRALL